MDMDTAELGRRYREGDGVPKDMGKAIQYLTEAADNGNVHASSSLGYIYMVGEGCDADPGKAEVYLRRAADGGVAEAMCNLGFLLSESDTDEAIRMFGLAADSGSVMAMKNLAALYHGGNGVVRDGKVAADWYRRASDMGDVDSTCVLASMYRNGDGIPVDKRLAVELYCKAADSGDPDAQYDLAFMLDSGEGVPVDHVTAREYFRKSADQGDTDACLCIGGILYEEGDYAGAENYFLKAAMKGEVKAQYNLGLLYIGGQLGFTDPVKASEWFSESAEQGFVLSHTMLGSILLDSGKVADAVGHFRTAAEQGEPTAMYNLGALGLSGQIDADEKESMSWVARAASQGFPPALELLTRLNG